MGLRGAIVHVLGAGALGFGVLGVVRPARLARMMGATEDAAREIGFRDVGNALLLYSGPGTTAGIAQRMLYDLSDVWVYGRRKRGVAIGGLSFAALCAVALRAD